VILLFLSLYLFSVSALEDNEYLTQLFYTTDQSLVAAVDSEGNITEWDTVTGEKITYDNPVTLTDQRIYHPGVTVDCDNKVAAVIAEDGLKAWYYRTGEMKSLIGITLDRISDISFSLTGDTVYILELGEGFIQYNLETMEKNITELEGRRIDLCLYPFNKSPYIGISWCDPGGGGKVDFYSLPRMRSMAPRSNNVIRGGERHSAKFSKKDWLVATNSKSGFFEIYDIMLSDAGMEFYPVYKSRKSYEAYSFSPDDSHIAVLKDPQTIGIINLKNPDDEMTELEYNSINIRDFVWAGNNSFVCLNKNYEMKTVDVKEF